jgi:hypothetical protein
MERGRQCSSDHGKEFDLGKLRISVTSCIKTMAGIRNQLPGYRPSFLSLPTRIGQSVSSIEEVINSSLGRGVSVDLSKLKKIQVALIISIIVFAAVTEAVAGVGSAEWTWRQWIVAGLALWTLSGGHRFRRLGRRKLCAQLPNIHPNTGAVRKWNAVQLTSLWSAESVAIWGVFTRLALHGARWQALPFYLVGLLFLLLWSSEPLIKGSARTQL